MFKLVIQDDEGKTTVVPLIRDEITIGRKEGNTIRLTERNVSRKHAKISRANGSVAIEDLGSYNGVRVNGTRISQRTVLTVSDRVQIGDYLIELKAEGTEQPPVPYEDARTQPIERLDAAMLARSTQPMTPAVSAGIALADTDPGARAVATAVPLSSTNGSPARVVVLSSNFAGREFQLTKPQMVIGRTDENDIVINHRSISRNHAKIVREPDTGRYTIMDLQSSNGVRVNGEDYGKVELRRGDTVDLGHVRLRFVESGEDFVFGRDAQIVDVPTGSKRGWIYALLGLVVVGGVVAVVMSGGSKKPSGNLASEPGGAGQTGPGTAPDVAIAHAGPGTAVENGTGTAVDTGTGTGATPGTAAVVAPETIDAAAATGTVTPSVDPARVAALMTDARAAMEGSKWAEASNVAQQLLKLEPDNTDARAIADQAKRELQHEIEYGRFVEAAQRKQYDRAVVLFEKLASDSVYKNKARDQYDQLHDQFLVEKKRDAQALAKARKCRDLRRLAVDAARVFPDARDVVSAVPCEDAVASTGPGTGGGTSPSVDKPSGDGGTAPTGRSATELSAEAQTAAKASQWGRALNVAEQALRAKPDSSTKLLAMTTAALAACNLKNTAKAKQYYPLLPVSRQSLIRQRCLANGVSLD